MSQVDDGPGASGADVLESACGKRWSMMGSTIISAWWTWGASFHNASLTTPPRQQPQHDSYYHHFNTSTNLAMHTVILGASRNIGYYSLLNLLAQDGNTVAVLLRSPQAFKDDPAVTPHIASGRLTIEQGDATVAADVAKVINDNTHIDFVISTIGSYPTLTLGGFQLPDPNLCTRAASALVTSLVALKQTPLPRVVAVSSMGIGAEHHIMPFAMRVSSH